MRVGGWGGRLVGLSPCPPFGIYSRVYVIHFGRCPFFVLSQPSHAVSAIKIVEMDLDCGLLLAIKQTLSCVRGLLATYLVRSLFFCLWEMPVFAKWSNWRLFCTVHQLQVGAMQSHFSFSFGCHSLFLTQPWNTIPLCHLHKLVKSFFFFFTPNCHLFQENVVASHTVENTL